MGRLPRSGAADGERLGVVVRLSRLGGRAARRCGPAPARSAGHPAGLGRAAARRPLRPVGGTLLCRGAGGLGRGTGDARPRRGHAAHRRNMAVGARRRLPAGSCAATGLRQQPAGTGRAGDAAGGAGGLLHRRAERTDAPGTGGGVAGHAHARFCRLLRPAHRLHALRHRRPPPATARTAGTGDRGDRSHRRRQRRRSARCRGGLGAPASVRRSALVAVGESLAGSGFLLRRSGRRRLRWQAGALAASVAVSLCAAKVRATTSMACRRAIANCAARRWTGWISTHGWRWPSACCARWVWSANWRRWCC